MIRAYNDTQNHVPFDHGQEGKYYDNTAKLKFWQLEALRQSNLMSTTRSFGRQLPGQLERQAYSPETLDRLNIVDMELIPALVSQLTGSISLQKDFSKIPVAPT